MDNRDFGNDGQKGQKNQALRKLCSVLSLVLLVLGLAAPALAQQPMAQPETSLGLADSHGESALGLDLDATPLGERVARVEIGWVGLDESTAVAEVSMEASTEPRIESLYAAPPNYASVEPVMQSSEDGKPAGKHGGFGRWIKKHWWVAALVGVGIGFAVYDDGDEEDD